MSIPSPIMVLDLGTNHTSALLLEKPRKGEKPQVLGSGIGIQSGIKNGMLADLQGAVNGIARATEQAERMANSTAQAVLVALPAAMCQSLLTKHTAPPDEIPHFDPKAKPAGSTLIHQNAVGYKLDGVPLKNPYSMKGKVLESEFHNVVVPKTVLENLKQVLKLCRFNRNIHFIPAPLAAAAAVLRSDETNVLFVDLGSQTTSFAIFAQANPIHIGWIPIGGNHITKDISHFVRSTPAVAEKLKLNPSQGGTITTLDHKKRVFHAKELDPVINARLEETFEYLAKAIHPFKSRLGFNYHLVLSGGGSRLPHTAAVAARTLSRPARIGKPSYQAGLPQAVCNASFATLIGTALEVENAVGLIKPKAHWIDKLGLWFKECFEDDTQLYQ